MRTPVRAAALGALLLGLGPVAQAQDCEVKIGVTGPMSGGASAWGLALKAGAEFQAALANEAGGIKVGDRACRVSVTTVDGGCTAAGGAAASNVLASAGIHAVLGPICSPETTGMKPVAKRNGQVLFSSSYVHDVIGPEFPLTFHLMQGPAVWGPILIDEAKKQFDFGSVMILGPNDQAGTDSGRQVAAMYDDVGVAVKEEYYQRGTTNFGAIVTRIMSANPDVVELAATPTGDVTLIVKQLSEAGYEGIFGGLGGIGLDPVAEGAGGVENLAGYFWLELMPVEDPGAQRLRTDFERIMGTPAPRNALLYPSSTATEQVLRAISAAGTDQDAEKIAWALRSATPESVYFGQGGWRGRAQYGINQELAFPVGMGVVRDGGQLGVRSVAIPSE